jgi:hypothetical protein
MESGAVATATSIEFSVVSGGLACIVGAVVIGLLMPHFREHVALISERDETEEIGGTGEIGELPV